MKCIQTHVEVLDYWSKSDILNFCENDLIFCVGVMYSGEYVCDVTASVYPHQASLKNMPGHGGNRTYDLSNTSPMLCHTPVKMVSNFSGNKHI